MIEPKHRIRNSYSNKTSYYDKKKASTYQLKGMRNKLRLQTLICGCLLMSVLVTQKLGQTTHPLYVKFEENLLGSFSYAPVNNLYESLFAGTLFPKISLSNPNTEEAIHTMGSIEEIEKNIAIEQYEEGIIVKTTIDEPILSLASGFVKHIATDEKYGSYIDIELSDSSELRIGFLENRAVSIYEHITSETIVGIGSPIDDAAYYYLSLKKDDVYLSLNEMVTVLSELD